ncbi:enoyl-CoA hydratase/isomerase family protein [Parasediminibacterium sp. JCM 36343]|uniref:enoyl-CoA hydratase/isomerase family protein n=1 Tax=Parasediminibacterium sp. JCM 36343 TaxID=3374279 RepID=UPI00397CD867
MYKTLLATLENGIFTITINRPDKLNALNKDVLAELNLALDEMGTNPAIQSAIITGSGQKAFVAGADISEFNDYAATEGKKLANAGQDTFFKIENSRKPIIACVNGFALGGGCELAMSCHIRIASANAKFGQPEVNLGLIPGYGGTQRLVQHIGKGRALEMMLSGNMVDAATAYQYGLVNHVVEPEALLPTAIALLQTINSKAPLAVAACIEAANAAHNPALNGYEVELDAFSRCFATADKQEGVEAFLGKRKAMFRGG